MTLLRWSLTFPGQSEPETRFISSTSIANSSTPLNESQTMFQFLRTSVSPLMSVMIIDNVAVDLNGTRVECTYGGSVVSTTTINVIRIGKN